MLLNKNEYICLDIKDSKDGREKTDRNTYDEAVLRYEGATS